MVRENIAMMVEEINRPLNVEIAHLDMGMRGVSCGVTWQRRWRYGQPGYDAVLGTAREDAEAFGWGEALLREMLEEVTAAWGREIRRGSGSKGTPPGGRFALTFCFGTCVLVDSVTHPNF